jgi:hypothetical protein
MIPSMRHTLFSIALGVMNSTLFAASPKPLHEAYEIPEVFPQATNIPKLMAEGKTGYAIFLDSGLKGKLKQLDAFIKHKESLGFRVVVVTEKEWGGGEQNQAVLNVRKWLVDNYKKHKLLYTLFIANPSTSDGNIPMAITPVAWTDWPYMDLDSDWTPFIPKDSEKGKKKEMKAQEDLLRNINGQADVFVGRIPWYGPESKYWKSEDVDAVLQRVIRYETDTRDKAWRFNWLWAEHGEGSNKIHGRRACDSVGADYVRLWKNFGDTAPPDGEPNEVKHILNERQETGQDPIGLIHYHSHGSGDSVCATINSKSAVELKDDYPAVHSFGSCSVATPRLPVNVVGTIFRFNGIAAMGPAMTVIGFSESRRPAIGSLETGMSVGEYFWERFANTKTHGDQGILGVNKTTMCYYLMGDPSVVPFVQRHGSYLQVSPYAAQYDKVIGEKSVEARRFTVTNNTDTAMDVKVAVDVPWVEISQSSLSVPARQSIDFTVAIDSAHPSLILGKNEAQIKVTEGSKNRTVKYTLEKKLPEQLYYNSMDHAVRGHRRNSQEKELGIALTKMDKGVVGKGILLDTPLELDGRPNELMIPGFDSFSLSFWFKDKTVDPNVKKLDTSKLSKEELKAVKKRIRKDDKKVEKHMPTGLTRKFLAYGGAWTFGADEEGRLTLDIVENKFLLPRDHPDFVSSTKEVKKMMGEQGDWSDYHAVGPVVEKDKWYHVGLVVDRESKKVIFTVNGKEYQSNDQLSFETGLLSVAKKHVNFVGTQDAFTVFDEFRYFDYPLTTSALAAMHKGKSPAYLKLPYAGDKRPTDNVTLIWESQSSSMPRVVDYATNPEFENVKSVKATGEESIQLKGLKNGETYFWRVRTKYGSQVATSSTSYFTTDDTVELAAPRVIPKLNKKPPVFYVGTWGADLALAKYVVDSPGDKHTYELISGPKWLTLTRAGIIFTPYGPKDSDIGENKIEFKVTDQTGLSVTHTGILKVAPPKPATAKKE